MNKETEGRAISLERDLYEKNEHLPNYLEFGRSVLHRYSTYVVSGRREPEEA